MILNGNVCLQDLQKSSWNLANVQFIFAFSLTADMVHVERHARISSIPVNESNKSCCEIRSGMISSKELHKRRLHRWKVIPRWSRRERIRAATKLQAARGAITIWLQTAKQRTGCVRLWCWRMKIEALSNNQVMSYRNLEVILLIGFAVCSLRYSWGSLNFTEDSR